MLQYITLFGHTVNLYDFFNAFAFLASFLIALYTWKPFSEAASLPKLADLHWNRKKSPVRHNIFIVINIILLTVAVLIPVELSQNPLSRLCLGKPDANFFPGIFFAPVLMFLFSVLLRSAPFVVTDCGVLMVSVALVFFKIACFCWGCCNGVACETFGMMNHNTGRVEFPVQLVEAACALIMLVILMVLIRKKNVRQGILYPLFMLMYCGSRFVSEFWRDDYPDIVGPLKSYHFLCIIGFVEGVVFLVVVLVWGKRIAAYFDTKNQAMLQKHQAKLHKDLHGKKKK